MRQRFSYPLILLAVIGLSACAPVQSPAPVYTPSSGQPEAPSEPRTEPVPSQQPPMRDYEPAPQQQRVPAIMPEEEKQPQAQEAVAALVNQAWVHFDRGDYEAALVVAERAQRLDARDPEVYLVMAHAHLARARLNAAEQLARKGMAFSRAGTLVRDRLQDVLREVATLR